MNAIDIFPWDDNFNTGLSKVDEQHRKLVQLLNALASHVAFHAEAPDLATVFDDLADYAVYHFDTEEGIWGAYLGGDPDEVAHRETHAAFVREVVRLRTALGTAERHRLAEEALGFLARWLASHILETDRAIAYTVQALQQGLSRAEAKVRAREQMGGSTRALIDIILSIYSSLSANTLRLMRELAERRQAEEALRKEVETNRALLYFASDGIHILDDGGNVVEASDAFCAMLGYTRDEVIGMNVAQWDALFDSDALGEMLQRQFRHRGRTQFETRHRRKDGGIIEVEVSGHPLEIDGRRLLYNASRDITARKRAEQDAMRQADFIAAVVEAQADGIAVCHGTQAPPHIAFSMWNTAMTALTGYTLDDVNRLGWYQTVYVDPAVQERARRRMDRMRDGDHLRGEEWTITRKDGTRRTVEIHTCFVTTPGGDTEVMAVMRDVTERREAERALRAAEEDQRTLIAALPDVIMRFDREGRHLFVSENVTSTVPIPAADFIGRTHHELGFPEALCAFWEGAIRQAFDTRQPHETEFTLDDPVAPRTFNWRLTPDIDESGQVRSVLAIAREITERKAAERELERHRQHLEELVMTRTADLMEAKIAAEAANRAKSTFLANMSHELRTPMNGVMGMLALAKRRMADDKGREHLDKAQGAAERLLGVLNDILDLSKIEADRMVLEVTPIQVGAILENVGSLLAARAIEKGLAWRIEIDDALARAPLLGDALRLGQVLINLAGNAIKFTERGHVTVKAAAADGDQESLTVRFEVSDSGIGIGPDALGRLFASFEQADNSMTRRYGGTGLGLAISKRLVQMMEGRIGVESAPGAGSTFWFVVRLKRRSPAAASGAVPPVPTSGERLRTAFSGTAILLAEDEPINREVALYMLEEAGLRVDTAEDGEEALRKAQATPYALILMDMQMPKLNGVDTTQAIRTDSLNRDTPIVALTANAYETDRRTCLASGMNDFLAKPVTADILYAALLRWLDRGAS